MASTPDSSITRSILDTDFATHPLVINGSTHLHFQRCALVALSRLLQKGYHIEKDRNKHNIPSVVLFKLPTSSPDFDSIFTSINLPECKELALLTQSSTWSPGGSFILFMSTTTRLRMIKYIALNYHLGTVVSIPVLAVHSLIRMSIDDQLQHRIEGWGTDLVLKRLAISGITTTSQISTLDTYTSEQLDQMFLTHKPYITICMVFYMIMEMISEQRLPSYKINGYIQYGLYSYIYRSSPRIIDITSICDETIKEQWPHIHKIVNRLYQTPDRDISLSSMLYHCELKSRLERLRKLIETPIEGKRDDPMLYAMRQHISLYCSNSSSDNDNKVDEKLLSIDTTEVPISLSSSERWKANTIAFLSVDQFIQRLFTEEQWIALTQFSNLIKQERTDQINDSKISSTGDLTTSAKDQELWPFCCVEIYTSNITHVRSSIDSILSLFGHIPKTTPIARERYVICSSIPSNRSSLSSPSTSSENVSILGIFYKTDFYYYQLLSAIQYTANISPKEQLSHAVLDARSRDAEWIPFPVATLLLELVSCMDDRKACSNGYLVLSVMRYLMGIDCEFKGYSHWSSETKVRAERLILFLWTNPSSEMLACPLVKSYAMFLQLLSFVPGEVDVWLQFISLCENALRVEIWNEMADTIKSDALAETSSSSSMSPKNLDLHRVLAMPKYQMHLDRQRLLAHELPLHLSCASRSNNHDSIISSSHTTVDKTVVLVIHALSHYLSCERGCRECQFMPFISSYQPQHISHPIGMRHFKTSPSVPLYLDTHTFVRAPLLSTSTLSWRLRDCLVNWVPILCRSSSLISSVPITRTCTSSRIKKHRDSNNNKGDCIRRTHIHRQPINTHIKRNYEGNDIGSNNIQNTQFNDSKTKRTKPEQAQPNKQ